MMEELIEKKISRLKTRREEMEYKIEAFKEMGRGDNDYSLKQAKREIIGINYCIKELSNLGVELYMINNSSRPKEETIEEYYENKKPGEYTGD